MFSLCWQCCLMHLFHRVSKSIEVDNFAAGFCTLMNGNTNFRIFEAIDRIGVEPLQIINSAAIQQVVDMEGEFHNRLDSITAVLDLTVGCMLFLRFGAGCKLSGAIVRKFRSRQFQPALLSTLLLLLFYE